MKAVGVLALLTLTLTLTLGCAGDSDDDTLNAVHQHLLDAESGSFHLSLEGTRDGKAVGFSVDGAFSYANGKGTYPIADLTYERRLGTSESSNQFLSDGTAAWVVDGAVVTPVAIEQLQGLREREGIAAAVADFEFASWFDDVERDGNRFTGTIDVGELVGDLRRLAAETDGNQAPSSLDGDAAEELEAALRRSSLEVEVSEDDELRSLVATLDFGDAIPDALDAVLVSYASPKLKLRITFTPLDGPLKVEVPGSG